MNPKLEAEFGEYLLSDIASTTADLGYQPTRFIQMVNEYGGVGACKRLLDSGPVSEGFCRLRALGRLDLSVESIILQEKWSVLFTEAESLTARWRLDNASAVCADPALRGRGE